MATATNIAMYVHSYLAAIIRSHGLVLIISNITYVLHDNKIILEHMEEVLMPLFKIWALMQILTEFNLTL